MKNWKKAAALLLAVLAFACAACAENRLEKVMKAGKLVVCTEPYFAPYEFIDNTKTGQEAIRGSDIELAKYIAKSWGVELELVPLSYEAVLAGVGQGKYDLAISGIAYTPERNKNLELSISYKPDEGHSVLVRKDTLAKYKKFADFDGLPVGVHTGTLQEQLAMKYMPKCNRRTFDTIQNAVLALDAGKLEGVVVSVTNAAMFIAAHPSLDIIGDRFPVDPHDGTCVAAQKGETEIIAAVNKVIEEVVAKDLFHVWHDAAAEEAGKLGIK